MSTAAVLPLGTNDSIAGDIRTPGEVDEFQVTLADSGRLSVEVQTRPGCSLDTRTSLLGPDSQLLIQSDGQSLTNRDDLIVQHLLPGTYLVQVEGLGAGTGAYTLTTDFQPANPPNQSLLVDYDRNSPFGLSPLFHVTGDFNGDGILDIATSNNITNDVTLLLGLGDGTFHSSGNFGVGTLPFGIVAGDFNTDGHLDLVVANQGVDPFAPADVTAPSYDLSLLLGNGDGTFQPEQRISAGTRAWSLATADLNGDGRLDLVIANGGSNDVSVLLGNGDGTFQNEVRSPTGKFPAYVATGDFNNDGRLDLAVTNFNSKDVSLLLGRGDGTFAREMRLAVGAQPNGIVAADVNGDNRLDLAITDTGADTVVILLGNGEGTFQSPAAYAVGSSPYLVVPGDFNGDGRLDLAANNRQSNDVSILLGRGDGTFQNEVRYRAGLQPLYMVAGDFNGDRHLDLATGNGRSHDVSLLLGLGDGTFQEDLTDPRRGETNPQGMALSDFNSDGILDLAVVTYTGHNVIVFLGRGDGTFQQQVSYQVGSTPVSLAATDVNGDGKLDLVTANCDSEDVSVLLGKGDGTFQDQVRYPAGASGEFLLAGDFNRDGYLDVIDGGEFSSGILLLLGNGDGTLQAPRTFGLDDEPAGGVAGDFNGDGKLDLAITNFFSPTHDVSVYLGNGDGTFQKQKYYPVGDAPLGIVAGDFNRDGKLDLAVSNSGARSVSLLLGNGDGTFLPEVRFATDAGPDFLATDDFNGDGTLDLAVSNAGSPTISVLLGRGNGTFADQVQFAASDLPTPRRGLAVADVNGDGRLDLVAAQVLGNNVAVLLGRGDGGFQAPLQTPVGFGPAAFTTGDFNNDDRLDVASVNPTTNQVAVSLGIGDATLQGPVRLPVGTAPDAIVRADFNRDGRLDLATANYSSGDVSVLLGLGDGTFRPQQRFAVGTNPVALVAADFNRDGLMDLATANAGSDDLSILLSLGNGTFQRQIRLPAGDLPEALVTGDFNGDGRADLAIANYRSKDVWVYLGRGNGTFAAPVRYALGAAPVSLVASDFNEDGVLDLATANYLSNDVSVLLGRADRTFQAPVRYEAGTNPVSVVVSDLDGDGHADLATANSTSQDVSFLLGRGDGTFASPVRHSVGDYPVTLAGVDFTDDGDTDLAIATQLAPTVSILEGLGDLRFVPGGTISNPIHATPLVADFNGDGLSDVAVVGRQGKILLRLARPGAPGVFEAPVTVNPSPSPAARVLAILSTPQGQRLAALDARSPSLSFYKRQPDGTFTRIPGPTIPGTLPVALAAGDLNGDRLTDLVVADAGSNEVLVCLQNASGGFGPAPAYDVRVGISPSALGLVDVDGDGRLDIVVTNQFSGDVSVLRNESNAGFASESRFRAGTGLYWLESHDGSRTDLKSVPQLVVRSREGTAGLVAGRFGAGPGSDLIVVNSGANGFTILRGDGRGGFLNPTSAQTYLTGQRPTVVVAGRFNNDPFLDLAVLNEGSASLSIFLGDGQGGFTQTNARDANGRTVPLSAGNLPTGLTVSDVNGDGRLDVLVGNDFGDVLTLLGNGDGTFQPYQRANHNIALAVADVNGDGRDDFIFGNERLDRVSVHYSQPGQTFVQDRGDGILAPGAVRTADLNADGLPDLVIANSGANNVLVYLGIGNGQFGSARAFFAGTNPADLTVQDLNGDGLLDLAVANEGSNDVTILLGDGEGAGWTLTPGPRLRQQQDLNGDGFADVFGQGPTSVTAQEVKGAHGPALVVTNSQSNNVFVLSSLGFGFFDDPNPLVFDTGASPQAAFIGNFDAQPGLDLVSVNAGSNSLTFFSNFTAPDTVGINIASGGLIPIAALAGDFNGDGLSDLVVANNGDGAISLFLGQEDGLSLEALRFLADLPHPTDLALAELTATELDVYVAGEGAEAARLLSFSDLGPIALATSESLGFAGSGQGQVADLLPLQDTTLATVAVLLTVRLESEALPARLEQEAGLAGDREAGPQEFVHLLLDRLGEQARGTEEGGALDPAGPDGPAVDRDALLELVTGRDETRAVRPALTREEVLNTVRPAVAAPGMPAVRQMLDEWMPGAAKALDDFWQAVADGSLRLGETAATALEPAITPVREGLQLLPELPLWEVVDGVAEGVLEAVRAAADAAGARLAPAWQGAPPSSQDANPVEPPAPEEKDLPLPRPSDPPRSELPRNAPAGEAAVAASLIATLFGAGSYRVLRKPSIGDGSGKRVPGQRLRRRGIQCF